MASLGTGFSASAGISLASRRLQLEQQQQQQAAVPAVYDADGVKMSAAAASPLRGLRGSAWAAARLAARAGGASASGTAGAATSTAYAVQQIAEMAQRRRTRAGQEADLSEHVKDRPQREGRRRSALAASANASAPDVTDDRAAARRATATPAAAVRVLELEGGEYAIRISLLPEVTQPDAEAAPAANSQNGGTR